MVIPSQVWDREYVRTPEGCVVESDAEWNECGKWTMITDNVDLRFVDGAWAALQPLVRSGALLMLKATTGCMRREGSAVICFTRPGKGEARRSAGAIREVVDFPGMMYYKLNGQTDAGMSVRNGHRNFGIYAHTYRGRFYLRDSYGTWVKDGLTSEDVVRTRSVASPSCRYLPPAERPSTSDKRYRARGQVEGPDWYLYCGLPTADRVWAAAGRLYREGAVAGIAWRKKDGMKPEIRLYVGGGADASESLEPCDRIFDETAPGTFMYFAEEEEEGRDVSRVLHSFTYTPERELYEGHAFVSVPKDERLLS